MNSEVNVSLIQYTFLQYTSVIFIVMSKNKRTKKKKKPKIL